jgi:hypothetical protein
LNNRTGISWIQILGMELESILALPLLYISVIFQIIIQSFLDFIGINKCFFSLAFKVDRLAVLDFLPPLITLKAELFIQSQENEAFSWFILINPFTVEVWLMLILVAALTAFNLLLIEKWFSKSSILVSYKLDYLPYLWLAFKANLGGKPSASGQPLIGIGKGVHKIIIFLCILAGSLNWMAYRGSITSELSIIKKTLPFNDLNGLAKSNFKYVLSFFCLHLSAKLRVSGIAHHAEGLVNPKVRAKKGY